MGVEENEKFAEEVSIFKAVNPVGVGKTLRMEELLVTEALVKAVASLSHKSSMRAPEIDDAVS